MISRVDVRSILEDPRKFRPNLTQPKALPEPPHVVRIPCKAMDSGCGYKKLVKLRAFNCCGLHHPTGCGVTVAPRTRHHFCVLTSFRRSFNQEYSTTLSGGVASFTVRHDELTLRYLPVTFKYSLKNSDETVLSNNARRLELVTNALDQMADALRLREPRLVDVVRTELMNLHFHSIAQKSDAIIPTNLKSSLLHPLNAKLLHDGLSNMSGAVAQLSLTANARVVLVWPSVP